MAVVGMNFLAIVGKVEEFDSIAQKYVANYDIHLEDAVNNFSQIEGIRAFQDPNPYNELLQRITSFTDSIKFNLEQEGKEQKIIHMTDEQAVSICEDAIAKPSEIIERRNKLTLQKDEYLLKKSYLLPFSDLDFDLLQILDFKTVKYRFGRLPLLNYQRLGEALDPDLDIQFVHGKVVDSYMWGMYFTTPAAAPRVDAIMGSMQFQRVYIPGGISGAPTEVIQQLDKEIERLDDEIAKANSEITFYYKRNLKKLYSAYTQIKTRCDCFNIRKFAARTDKLYFIVGWIKDTQVKEITQLLDKESGITYALDKPSPGSNQIPPTALSNNPVSRPFEMYVKMFGLPNYNEIDPTLFMSITYPLLFGMMYGDVGHGGVLAILGYLLYKCKHVDLGGILGLCGVSATIFGFMYGSIFGNEHLLHPLWLSPQRDIMTILITTVGIGILLIFMVMLMNIYVSIKNKDYSSAFLSPNGLSGLIFYATLISLVVLPIFSMALPTPVVIVLVITCLCLMAAEVPVHRRASGKPLFPDGKGQFVLETFFELFEVLLSYVTNTISFVRVGAFALSHGGMMMVVEVIMRMEGGFGSIVVYVFGNLFVMALEGLIVSIQVLRLAFYEMFSRFYKGNGYNFRPFRETGSSIRPEKLL